MSTERRKKKSLLVDDLSFPIQKIAISSENSSEVKSEIVVPKQSSNAPVVQNSAVTTTPKITSAPPQLSIRPQSISITKPKVIENVSSTNIVCEPIPVLNLNNSFDDNEFFSAWEKFQNTLSDEKKVGFSNLNIPTRKEEAEFIVLVNNVMQENEAKKLLSEAVQFLRAQLNNSAIVISTKIAEETEKQRTLSPEQRYMEMVAKNPQLEEFRKLLSLEID